MEKSGAEIVLACLKKNGVSTVFGYPGGAVIPLYDALYENEEKFTHVRAAHEQGAVHAADGYARVTGKLGVCFATSGPGATNTVTGIATAYMDSVPILVITGQVPGGLLGRDAFQEIDITGMTVPITKHNLLVRRAEDIEKAIDEAVNIATRGRPGPVLIDITKDAFVQKAQLIGNEKSERIKPLVVSSCEEKKRRQAVEWIDNAKRPVIYAGGGICLGKAEQTMLDFAQKSDIPVINTLMGLGSIPRNHRLSYGLVGMHGFSEANTAMSESDLVIAVGARFSDRVVGNRDGFRKNRRIIHIDIDKTELGKNMEADIQLCGEVKSTLESITNGIKMHQRQSWNAYLNGKKKSACFRGEKMNPQMLIKGISQKMENATVVTDVGQHQMWTAQHWPFLRTRQFLTSGGLGTMGYGLGAAIGAQMGNPNQSVVLITGDGSFQMNCNELVTVSSYNLPLVIVIMNNGALGMVRQWQKLFQNERYASTCLETQADFVHLAAAYGIYGMKVENEEDLKIALSWEGLGKKPFLIDCRIDKDEDVYPIVPPGKPLSESILF